MLKPKTVLPAAVLALTATLTGCGSTDGHDMGSMSTPAATAPSSPPEASGAATPAAGPHNDADVMFATMMIPHHQQAVQMSEILLAKNSVDPAVRDLATQIKAAQGPEITQMSGWLAGWGANPSPSSMGDMDGMDHGSGEGMMSQADMDAFQQADGAQAQQMFLEGMIKHHRGAVEMAKTELTQGQNPDAKTLAQNIITTQNAEITQMQKLLGS